MTGDRYKGKSSYSPHRDTQEAAHTMLLVLAHTVLHGKFMSLLHVQILQSNMNTLLLILDSS